MTGEGFEYLKTMIIVLAIGALAFVAVRYWLPKMNGIRGSVAGPIRVACRLTIEPRKTLYVVHAGSDYLMLAASEAGVQFLTSLDRDGIQAALEKTS